MVVVNITHTGTEVDMLVGLSQCSSIGFVFTTRKTTVLHSNYSPSIHVVLL